MSQILFSDQPPPELSCAQCIDGAGLDFDFSFAFQPIVNVQQRQVHGYEALVRGPAGEPAMTVLERLHDGNRYRFDQACRVKAIRLASELDCQARLSVNFLPNAVYRPELCIRTTIEAARRYQFPIERITFEFIEGEQMTDHQHVRDIVAAYRKLGMRTAIDDFGAGYSGLNLLADYQPDILKLDMLLVRDIDTDPARQAIVEGVLLICGRLGLELVAEGIETREEYLWLKGAGVSLMQGYYFARPGFETLPDIPGDRF